MAPSLPCLAVRKRRWSMPLCWDRFNPSIPQAICHWASQEARTLHLCHQGSARLPQTPRRLKSPPSSAPTSNCKSNGLFQITGKTTLLIHGNIEVRSISLRNNSPQASSHRGRWEGPLVFPWPLQPARSLPPQPTPTLRARAVTPRMWPGGSVPAWTGDSPITIVTQRKFASLVRLYKTVPSGEATCALR